MMEEELLERFVRVVRRHLRKEDAELSDRDLVTAVLIRFLRAYNEPIIDVSE